MNPEYYIQLTNDLYRLTLLFPKKEPLRYKMRELADEILSGLILLSQENLPAKNFNIGKNLQNNLKILDSFFELARNQNWVSPSDILKLQQDYSKIIGDLKSTPKIISQPENYQIDKTVDFSVSLPRQEMMSIRQQKILGILREKGRAQVWEMKKIFPEVSKRTLRRDFENLLKKGLIERMGEKNDTFYQLRVGHTYII